MSELISKPTFSTMIRSPTWMPLLFTFTVPAERDKEKISLMHFKKSVYIVADAYNDHFKLCEKAKKCLKSENLQLI